MQEKSVLLQKIKLLGQKRDRERKNFTVHSIASCVNCRWFVKSIMHWLADGEAVVSAGWMCWLKFEENTDNTVFSSCWGEETWVFHLQSWEPDTRGHEHHCSSYTAQGREANGPPEKNGLLANKFSWLVAASGVTLIKYSWSSVWLKFEVLTIPSWTQLSPHESTQIQGIQVSSTSLLQLGLSKRRQCKKIKQLILNC